ncbi:MAG: L-rhamnose mutarotase [Saprospiraceae bacterium]|nr:L-rhamnose mutarotase [Saprospiraceae bacterium]
MKRYCLTLDLKDDPHLIASYERYHQRIPEAIEQSIREAGILDLQIFRLGTRMCMIMETSEDFSFEKKAAMDAANPAVQEWEAIMWQFQVALPQAKPGEKWLLMEKIFQLNS